VAIVINFKPSVKQYKAWELLSDNVTSFVGYGGAAFSGKSYLLCYWLTSMSIAYPGTAWGLGRKQLTTLKKTTLITLFKVFGECNIVNGIDYKYNQQNNTVIFSCGSVIFLIDTMSQPSDPLFTRFGGLELTGAAIDESAETDYKAIEVLSTRIGRRLNDKYNLPAKMLETFNPAKNHVFSRYYKPHHDNTEKADVKFIPALPGDNPSPEVPAYIARIKSTGSKVTIERLINGNFMYDDDPSALMIFNKIQDAFTNSFAERGEKYISADIARFGSDNTVIGVWDGFVLEKIITIDKNKVTEAADEIRKLADKYSVPLSNIIIDDDGVGGGVTDILGCNGFVNNSKPLLNPETKEEDNFNNLKSQCYFKLSDLINSNSIWIRLEEYKQLITEELEQVKQKDMDKDGKKMVIPKDKVKELLGRSPDFSDMIMMRMWFMFKRAKEHDFGW
jgi:phage terminase large subunit